MTNLFSLYSFLFEADTSDLLGDLLASVKKSDSSGPEKNMDKTLEDMNKKLGDVDQRLKTIQKGSTEETNARSTTGAKKPLPTTVSLPPGISSPKASGTAKPEIATLSKELTTSLTKDRKFVDNLAKQITTGIKKSEENK